MASFWSLFNQNVLNLLSYKGHCEIERSFSAPSILSRFWAFIKIFLIWLAHALGSGIDSKNNNNPYTVISFSYMFHRYPICFFFFFFFFNSSLLWDVFIINSVEQLQTLPKSRSEIDISPFLKTQKKPLLIEE